MKFRKSETYIDAKQNGRAQKTTFKTFILMKKKWMSCPTCSAKEIWADLKETGISVSRRTLDRRLVQEFSLKTRTEAITYNSKGVQIPYLPVYKLTRCTSRPPKIRRKFTIL